jgi:hypothetical protein
MFRIPVDPTLIVLIGLVCETFHTFIAAMLLFEVMNCPGMFLTHAIVFYSTF